VDGISSAEYLNLLRFIRHEVGTHAKALKGLENLSQRQAIEQDDSGPNQTIKTLISQTTARLNLSIDQLGVFSRERTILMQEQVVSINELLANDAPRLVVIPSTPAVLVRGEVNLLRLWLHTAVAVLVHDSSGADEHLDVAILQQGNMVYIRITNHAGIFTPEEIVRFEELAQLPTAIALLRAAVGRECIDAAVLVQIARLQQGQTRLGNAAPGAWVELALEAMT
jgi:hypothetical protein